MTHEAESLWTLDELSARVALALADDYDGQPSRRVREVPDQRTIRYYTTLGLLDRPAQMRGRIALYSRRHLLQLVAIKRLQSRGTALAEVQEYLLGLPNARLEALAQVRKDAEFALPSAPASPSENETNGRRESFWLDAPAAPRENLASSESGTVAPSALQAIALPAGVLLLLPATRAIHANDIEAIHSVAAPLLKLLEKRRLLTSHPERGTA